MRRTIGMAILGVAVGAMPVLARPGDGPRHGPRDGRDGHRYERLAERLGLTEAQRAEWKRLATEHREAMQPLREEGRALRERSRAAVENDEPDAAVGQAMKALRAHREQVRAEREAFFARLEAVLDDAQKEKYEALKAARKEGRKGRRGRGPREERFHGGGRSAGEPPVEG